MNDATTLTAAIGDMEIAYLDAEGRVSPNFTELGAVKLAASRLLLACTNGVPTS